MSSEAFPATWDTSIPLRAAAIWSNLEDEEAFEPSFPLILARLVVGVRCPADTHRPFLDRSTDRRVNAIWMTLRPRG